MPFAKQDVAPQPELTRREDEPGSIDEVVVGPPVDEGRCSTTSGFHELALDLRQLFLAAVHEHGRERRVEREDLEHGPRHRHHVDARDLDARSGEAVCREAGVHDGHRVRVPHLVEALQHAAGQQRVDAGQHAVGTSPRPLPDVR
jgi:hypothetical protein